MPIVCRQSVLILRFYRGSGGLKKIPKVFGRHVWKPLNAKCLVLLCVRPCLSPALTAVTFSPRFHAANAIAMASKLRTGKSEVVRKCFCVFGGRDDSRPIEGPPTKHRRRSQRRKGIREDSVVSTKFKVRCAQVCIMMSFLLVSKESWVNNLLISQATKDIHLIGQYFVLVDIFMVSQNNIFIHLNSQGKTICTEIKFLNSGPLLYVSPEKD